GGDQTLIDRTRLQFRDDAFVLLAHGVLRRLATLERERDPLFQLGDAVHERDDLAVLAEPLPRALQRLVLGRLSEQPPQLACLVHRSIKHDSPFVSTYASGATSARTTRSRPARSFTTRGVPYAPRLSIRSTTRRACPAPISNASRPPGRRRSGAPSTSASITASPSPG